MKSPQQRAEFNLKIFSMVISFSVSSQKLVNFSLFQTFSTNYEQNQKYVYLEIGQKSTPFFPLVLGKLRVHLTIVLVPSVPENKGAESVLQIIVLDEI